MMSPMALRRTISRLSNRGALAAGEKESVILIAGPTAIRTASRFSRPQPRTRTNNVGCRVILGITHDDNPASTGFDLIAFGDTLHHVVGALGMKIRTYFADDSAHIFFRKDYDGVHIRERRQNLRAFFGRHHWPPFTFQRAHGSIGVQRNNQFAAKFPRGMQVANVANMQQVENTIGQRDAIASVPPIRHTLLKFVARNNLLME